MSYRHAIMSDFYHHLPTWLAEIRFRLVHSEIHRSIDKSKTWHMYTHTYIYIYTETSYTYTIINIRLSICIYTWYIQNILIVYVSSPHPIHGDSSNATQDGKLLGQKYGVTTGLIQAIANSRGQRNAWGYLAETGQQWWVNSPAALLAFRKDTCLFVGHVSFY